jgi:hypothetical protein
MKSHLFSQQSALPRRGWLGGILAATAALLGWRASGASNRRGFKIAPQLTDAVAPATRAKLEVKPAPDSVKRHG